MGSPYDDTASRRVAQESVLVEGGRRRRLEIMRDAVTPGGFATAGMRPVAGRDFGERRGSPGARVVALRDGPYELLEHVDAHHAIP